MSPNFVLEISASSMGCMGPIHLALFSSMSIQSESSMSLLIRWGTSARLLEERLQIISKSLKLLHSSENLPSAALLIPFVCRCLESTSDTQGLKYGRPG